MPKILVTGNPRSGTLSMKNMLRSAGYDVQHERCGSQGTVSCFFFGKAPYYPREKLTANRHLRESFDLRNFSVIIHLVRNPLYCIPSMAKIVGTGHRKWLEDMGVVQADIKPKIKWSAAAWLRTNEVIQKTLRPHYVVRIEHVVEDWPEVLDRPPEVLHQHRGSGTRRATALSRYELIELTELAHSILKQAKTYGYKL